MYSTVKNEVSSPGKILRLSKIVNPNDGKAVVVAADHGFMLGPIEGVRNLEKTLRSVIRGGPDAVLLTPGQAALLNHLFHGRKSPALLVRADWTNAFRTKKYTLPARDIERTVTATAKDALALGASGIVTYYFVGCPDETEARSYKLMATFAKECNEVGLPLIVEPLAMGERVTGANFADLVATTVRIAVEAGADAIKTQYTGDVESFKKVVKAAGVPVLILGGAKARTMRDALEVVVEALEAGASGVVYGRQVIQAPDPAGFVATVRAVVHEGKNVREALGAVYMGPICWTIDPQKCTGCHICELACSFHHEQAFTFSKARIRVDRLSESEYQPVACSFLLKRSLSMFSSLSPSLTSPANRPLCVEVCGSRALTIHPTLGYLQFRKERCSGCKKCVKACPLHLIPFDEERKIPLVCDMCEGSPECVEWCQPQALMVVGLKSES